MPLPEQTKIVLCVKFSFELWSIPASLVSAIRSRWPQMRTLHVEDYAKLPAELPDADIFVGFFLSAEQFSIASNLKWMHITAAGVSQMMRPDVRRRAIVITNARGIHTIPMAEHAMGMMVALAHKFSQAIRAQLARRWAQEEMWNSTPRPAELRGRILVLIGLGAVGREIARYAKAFGMHVWAVTRSGRGDSTLAERIFPASDLDRALSEADYAIVAAPETPQTRAIIGAKQLAAMKPSAFLLNLARGSLVDEAALTDALQKRLIGGAALDVTEREPLPSDSPLWDLEILFITPHTSAATEELWDRQTKLLLENLERWFAGRELINLVDQDLGY